MILLGATLPLLAAGVLGVTARSIARRLPPRTTVPLLTGAALVIAAAVGFVLAVVAFTFAGSDAAVAGLGHWSAPIVARLAEIPAVVGVPAAGLFLILAGRTVRRLGSSLRALWNANAECRRLGEGIDGLIVVDDDSAHACALPGLTGRILVSRGMLAALTPAERRVLLAHERSHLQRRHALYVQLAHLAAAANPLLRPVATAVSEGVERCADEDAASVVGDRALVARALAHAAVATGQLVTPDDRHVAALAMTGSAVTMRARALLAPPPQPRRLLAAVVLGCVLAAAAGAGVVEHTAEHTFERAGSATAPR